MVTHCMNQILHNAVSTYQYLNSRHHLRVKICWRLVSLFMASLLLHVPTCKMINLLDTCTTYIKYIEVASFSRLITRSNT
jgi:hypothetical protein